MPVCADSRMSASLSTPARENDYAYSIDWDFVDRPVGTDQLVGTDLNQALRATGMPHKSTASCIVSLAETHITLSHPSVPPDGCICMQFCQVTANPSGLRSCP